MLVRPRAGGVLLSLLLKGIAPPSATFSKENEALLSGAISTLQLHGHYDQSAQ